MSTPSTLSSPPAPVAQLLDLSDLGATFAPAAPTTPVEPTPCNVDVDAAAAALTRVAVSWTSTTSDFGFTEEASTYGTEAAATAAFDAVVSGYSCGRTDQAVMEDPVDVSAELGSTAMAISFASLGTEGYLVVTRTGGVIATFLFNAETAPTDDPNALQPLHIVQLGAAKLMLQR